MAFPKHICILRLSAIGDCTHVIPIIRTIQKHHPETKITWVIGKLEYTLLAGLESVEFIVFDKSQGKQGIKDFHHAMKNRHFDVLLNMQIALRSSLLSRHINAPIKLGYDRKRAKDFQWLFTNKRINHVEKQHVLDVFFEFIKALGLSERSLSWDIPIEQSVLKEVDTLLNVNADSPILVINPCTSNRARNWRNWSAQNYAKVADYAAKKYGCHIVLTGGPTEIEKSMAAQITGLAQVDINNLVGKTSLKALLAILSQAKLMISPDTGPAHMATTVGTPVVGLFATSNPYRTGPYLSLDHVVNYYPQNVQQEFGCEVEKIKWGKRVRNPQAMLSIPVEDVCCKIDQLLASTIS